jgi:general secretion pathway protein G
MPCSEALFLGSEYTRQAILLPCYSPRKAREQILNQDLITLREIVSQYTLDNHRRPHSLNDLVAPGYLKELPTDPTKRRKDTWVVVWSHDPKTPGIIEIRSRHR